MTDPQTPPPPRPSGSISIQGRHLRTIIGVVLMLVGVGAAIPWLIGQLHSAPNEPAVTFLEIVYELGFPVLLVAAGYNLFSASAFSDLVDKAKSFIPGRGQ